MLLKEQKEYGNKWLYGIEKKGKAYELFENKRDGVIKVAVEC